MGSRCIKAALKRPPYGIVARPFQGRVCAAAICAIACVVALGAQTPPADRAQTEALAKRAAERMAALQREAESLAHQEQTLIVELRKLELDRQIKTEQLAAVERDAADVRQQVAAANARAAALQADANRQQPDLEVRLVHIYKMGRAG